jgi:hypothetical protein
VDITDFSTPKDLLELLGHMDIVQRANRRGRVRKFRAKALTDGISLSSVEAKEYASGNSNPDKITRYILKARIEQSDLYRFNPHAYLVDPCALEFTGDVNEALRLTKMHTTCLTSKNFDLGAAAPIRRGDIIEISCKVNRRGETDIEICTATKIIERAKIKDGTGTARACVSLTGVFQSQAVSLVGTPTPTVAPPAPDSPAEDSGDE